MKKHKDAKPQRDNNKQQRQAIIQYNNTHTQKIKK